MIVALALALGTMTAPAGDYTPAINGVDMTCTAAGAHIALWSGPADAPVHIMQADAAEPAYFVADLNAWTVTAKPSSGLAPKTFGLESSEETLSAQSRNVYRFKTILGCGPKEGEPLRIRISGPKQASVTSR